MRLINLLEGARKCGASDVHLVVGMPPIFRVNGDIVTAKGEAVSPEQAAAIVEAELNEDQKARLQRDWQLCLAKPFGNGDRARIQVYFRNRSPELSIRLSQPDIRSREELNLPEVVNELSRKPNGLVIITGPTGVGKTTTFHYMVDLINKEQRQKIITIEDPIEFTHSYKRSIVIQQEVLTDVHDFRSGLVAVLRQDPDVIGIGEMRDPETIYTALVAAETGHLVIATLHTPSAVEVVQRLISVFSEGQQNEIRLMIANALQGVVAQQLLPRAAGGERILCCEVLIVTHGVRRQIRENQVHQVYSEMQTGQKYGMITMDKALTELYQRGEITYDTAMSMARYPETFKKTAS